VEEAAARLGYCSVDAPISGIVWSTNVSPGQLVSTMVPVALLTMVDDSARRVRAFVDEGDISMVCSRQHARVTADASPGIQMDGIVESIGAAVVDNPFVKDSSRQFRQVMLSLSGDQQQLVCGYRYDSYRVCPGRAGLAGNKWTAAEASVGAMAQRFRLTKRERHPATNPTMAQWFPAGICCSRWPRRTESADSRPTTIPVGLNESRDTYP
jgi:HlyD family secretion protein